jgi:tRNA synthetases class I (I, L, M and V)/Protein of unknown function (DUF835)/Anticodon-binding domain of tRNA ligase
MVPTPEPPDPKAIELEARALWTRVRLPPPSGVLGPAEGPVVHQLEGSYAPQEAGMLVVQRAVAADVDARALTLTGRRAAGVLRREESGPPTSEHRLEELLTALGVWVGGGSGRPVTCETPREAVQTVTGRLAHAGAIAVRDVALRVCPACALARDPERIVYREESGDTLLVRFPFTSEGRTVSALVWTDSAWRLLGTSALLLHPELPYVVARYRRGTDEELVLTSKSSLDRIRRWLRGAELEVLEEHPGRHWESVAYVHPLLNEFPIGGGLEPPAGTIQTAAEVTDTGTGVVPLVPGHGGTDAGIASRLGVPGWPLLTPKGRFDIMLVHKYAGLELETGDDFVGRDLAEAGAIFARLRVRRGVPHCARCGSRLIWAPGRAWCLEPSRLPPATLALYRSVLPRDRPIERLEAVPWPISEPLKSDDSAAVTLLECTSCDRLEAPGAGGDRCSCGGRRRPVGRRLLPAFEAAAAGWGPLDPFPPADAVRLYVNERRRAPAVVHSLAAMSGIAGTVNDLRVTVLPTVPEVDFADAIAKYGADAVRAALVRAQSSEGRTATFTDHCSQERERLDRFLRVARSAVQRLDGPSLATLAQPIGSFLGELEPEDRALLARFERMRIQAIADYDRGVPAAALRRVGQFLDNELGTYRQWTQARIGGLGASPAKRAAFRTTVHILLQSTLLLAPVVPHTAEAVHGTLAPRHLSVFEETVPGVDRSLLDDDRARAWDRWSSVISALARARRALRLAPSATLPSVVVVLPSDGVADAYRSEAAIVERLARVGHLEIASPSAPWAGRRRQLRPVEAEIQRVYASRAAQIIHLLRRASERKVVDPGPQGFSLMVNGQPTQILPSMLDWVETLPERTVPVPWHDGEMYIGLPQGATPAGVPAPPLSADAFRLVERVRHRLRESAGTASSPAVVLVVASGGLGTELTNVAAPLAANLGLKEFRVVPSERELPPGRWEHGREHSGASWAFHLTGEPREPIPSKRRPSHGRGERVRPAFAPDAIAPTVRNYADDEFVQRHTAVRALGDELDELLGRPLIGPSKVDAAWDAGMRTIDDFRHADWDTLVALPGFGVPVASALVEKLGGIVPPPPPRRPRVLPVNGGREEPEEPTRLDDAPQPFVPAPPPSVPAPPVAPSRLPTAPPLPFTAVPIPPVVEPPPPPPIAQEAVGGPAFVRETPTEILAAEPVTLEPPAPTEPDAGSSMPSPEPQPIEPPSTTAPDAAVVESAPAGAPSEPPVPTELAIAEPPGQLVVEPEAVPTSPPPLDEVVLLREDEGASSPPEIVTSAPEPSRSEPSLPEATSETPAAVEVLSTPAEPTVREDPPSAEDHEAAPETDGAVEPTGMPDPEMLTATAPDRPIPIDVPPEVDVQTLQEPAPSEPGATSETGPLEAPAEAPLPPEPEPAPEPSLGDLPEPVPPTVEPSPEIPQVEPSSAPALTLPEEAPPVPPASETPTTVPASEPPAALIPPPPPSIAELPSPVPVAPLPPVREPAFVAPAPPTPPAPVSGVELDVATSYLPALERFLDATAAGHLGMCVVRDSPERVRAYAGSRPVEIRWLTNIGRGATLKPTDLEGLAAFLEHTLSSGRVTVFFLEGVEYLVRLHGLDRVVEELLRFDAAARSQSARVWVPLNPKLLSAAELERFVSAFGSKS